MAHLHCSHRHDFVSFCGKFFCCLTPFTFYHLLQWVLNSFHGASAPRRFDFASISLLLAIANHETVNVKPSACTVKRPTPTRRCPFSRFAVTFNQPMRVFLVISAALLVSTCANEVVPASEARRDALLATGWKEGQCGSTAKGQSCPMGYVHSLDVGICG